MENAANERQARHPSVASSHRYHSDPLKNPPTHPEETFSDGSFSVEYPPVPNADTDNYLIPDRHNPNTNSVTYTPVVTGHTQSKLLYK